MAIHSGIGAPNGPLRSAPLDGWFRYPAGFSEVARRRSLNWLEVEKGLVVADPFAGAAIGGTAISAAGGVFRGIEAHPEIAELANLKFQRVDDPTKLMEEAARLARSVARQATAGEHILVRRCFDAPTLGVLTALRDEIQRSAESRWHPYLKWALLATLRDCANAAVGWPYQRPDVDREPIGRARQRFLYRVSRIVDDLREWNPTVGSKVVAGDSRRMGSWRRALGRQLADACLSSPPYLNNYDYADATRLELFFWRTANSWGEMVRRVREPMMHATTQQSHLSASERAIEELRDFPRTYPAFQELHDRLVSERRRRVRGKEYDLLLPLYFADMARVLANMRRALRPRSRIALVLGDSAPYGVYVNTPKLTASLATELGFRSQRVETLRQRGLRWRNNDGRHRVALSECLVLLEAPM